MMDTGRVVLLFCFATLDAALNGEKIQFELFFFSVVFLTFSFFLVDRVSMQLPREKLGNHCGFTAFKGFR